MGLNGSGKSSLLKIMAGVDTEFLGEAFPAKKMKVGYLEQEPHLDETMTVKENIFSHMGELPKLMKDYNAINEKFKKVHDAYMAFRNDEYLWWQVAEFSYDNFMIRQRAKG